MDCSPPGSTVQWIFQARILQWVAISFSRGSSQPRDPTCISCINMWILYHWATTETLICIFSSIQFSSFQLLSHVWLFATPWTTAHQASPFITNSQSLLKLMSIKSVMPSNHLILIVPFSSCPQSLQHQGLFQWVNSSHEVAKVLEFQLQHQSFQWTPRTGLL